MSEVNEMIINNEIDKRWKKDEYKRNEVDFNKLSEEFRVICSSRSSIMKIIKEIKNNGLTVDNLKKLNSQMGEIFNWVTTDKISSIKENYYIEIKDQRKLKHYRNEIRFIDEYYKLFRGCIINETLDKLLEFYNVGGE